MYRLCTHNILRTLNFTPKYCYEFPKQHSEIHGNKVLYDNYRF